MKKKILLFISTILLCISLAGCSGGSQYSNPGKGLLISIPGQECLYYDANTKNVYIVYSEYTGYQGYGYMSAYFAPNGLPYLYDISTGCLIENTTNSATLLTEGG